MPCFHLFRQAARHFLLAWLFFTKIPLPPKWITWADYDAQAERASLAYLPIIGLVVGIIASAGFWSTFSFLSWKINAHHIIHANGIIALFAAIIAVIIAIACTGALHEDGWADAADALMPGRVFDKNRVLAIMKDPHLGVWAVLALGLGLALKIAVIALLGIISPLLTAATICSAHIFSRLAPVILLRTLPYIGHREQSKSPAMTAHQVSGRTLIMALIFSLLAPLILWALPHMPDLAAKGLLHPSASKGIMGILAVMLWSLGALWMLAGWFKRRLGGITGDCLGAGQQIMEMAWMVGVVFFII